MAKQEPVNPVAPYLAPKLLDGLDWGVPLVALLAQPVWFDGRAVRVPGFLAVQFEHTALYIGEADYRHRLMANSVWVNLPSEALLSQREYHERYVLIDGVFRVGPTGHRGGSGFEASRASPARELLLSPQCSRGMNADDWLESTITVGACFRSLVASIPRHRVSR